MKVFIYIRKVLFLFLCGALSFSYGYGQELPLLPDTIKPLLSDSNLIDELITVGYATGNRSTLSGSVNRVNEGGMNEGLISTPWTLLGEGCPALVSRLEEIAPLLGCRPGPGYNFLDGR